MRVLGAAYSRAEKRVQELITKLRLPFLPTPMAKGMLPDEHFLSVGSARSRLHCDFLDILTFTTVLCGSLRMICEFFKFWLVFGIFHFLFMLYSTYCSLSVLLAVCYGISIIKWILLLQLIIYFMYELLSIFHMYENCSVMYYLLHVTVRCRHDS